MDRRQRLEEGWRAKAREMFPQLQEELGDAETPMSFWLDVSLAFELAYEEPRNEDLIRCIYQYAFWCLNHGERDATANLDLPTCVAVCFYEHIPRCKAAREDMPHWFSREEVHLMRQTFSYHLDEGEFEQLLDLYSPLNPSRKDKRKARKQCKRPL